MTKAAWWRENGISVRQLYYWQRKLRNMMPESSNDTSSKLISARQDVPEFCELPVPLSQETGNLVSHNDSPANRSELIVEINGCRILIGNSVSRKTLSSVIEVIRHV